MNVMTSVAQPTFEQFLQRVSCAVQKPLTLNHSEFELNGVLIRLIAQNSPISKNCIVQFELIHVNTNAQTNSYLLSLNRDLAIQSVLTGFFALNQSRDTILFIQKIQLSEIPVLGLLRFFQDTVSSLFDLFAVQVNLKLSDAE